MDFSHMKVTSCAAHICGRLKHCFPGQDDVAATFEYYADLAEQLDKRQNERLDVGEEDFTTTIRREPMGVVALISMPWILNCANRQNSAAAVPCT